MFRPLLVLACALLATAACATDSSSPVGSATPTPSPSATTPAPTPTPITGCVEGLGPGDHVVPCDGLEYAVRVPASCPGSGCGLILDVHGLTMDAGMQEANTRLRTLGEANGFVVVQPNAPADPPASSWSELEYPKVHAFVLDAVLGLSLDADRVHVTGFSQGGQMTFAMVCRWPEDFASAAPGAAAGGDCFTAPDASPPARQVPLLQIHGTSDVLVPFATGQAQRDAVIAAFGLGNATVVAAGSSFSRTRYTNASGMVLEFLQHDHASPEPLLLGHCFPGSTDPGGAQGQLFSFACAPPNDFVYGQQVIDFFLAHPRG